MAWNWENKKDRKYGIPYSRYVASWYKVGGKKVFGYIEDWLKSIGVHPDDAYEIANMATNGKLELEASAEVFMRKVPFKMWYNGLWVDGEEV